MPFEIFEHTADIGLHVEADDLDGLFADAARGLFDVVRGDNAVARERTFEFDAEAEGPTRLLVRFLNELVFLMDAEGVVFADVQDVRVTQKAGGWRVHARASGEPFSHGRHPGCLHVKAATRHEATLVAPAPGSPARARVILDV